MLFEDVVGLEESVQSTFSLLSPSILKTIKASDGCYALAVVVLDPRKVYSSGAEMQFWSNTYGEKDPEKWPKNFLEIALAKANICWREGMDSRCVGENAPWLYKAGDTRYSGGVVRNKLVVAASGLDWQYDEAIALSVASFVFAGCRSNRDAVMNNKRSPTYYGKMNKSS